MSAGTGIVNRIISLNAAVPSNFNRGPCRSWAAGIVVCGCVGGIGVATGEVVGAGVICVGHCDIFIHSGVSRDFWRFWYVAILQGFLLLQLAVLLSEMSSEESR